MDTVFTNFKNIKTSDPERLLISLINKVNWKRSVTYVALSNPSMYSTWQNKINEFKILASKWNEEFELPDGSYSISDIQV